MQYSLQGNIQSSHLGYQKLTALAAVLQDAWLDDIDIDLRDVRWFDANMCAPLGALLYRAGSASNTVRLHNINPNIEHVLARNGFLSAYGRSKLPDHFGTAIPYQRFEVKDERAFAAYVEQGFSGMSLPAMTPGLQKKFRESIHEIFSNAVLHSQTRLGIFACGQFFPNDHRLDFSIADLGIGIRANVTRKLGSAMSDIDAIGWAVEHRNTTKTGAIPGGLGLKLLRDFIKVNQGRMEIVSARGYWMQHKDQVTLQELEAPFPGTVVNIEIDMADQTSYCLASEVHPEDIF
ncbi:MAG: ATP-binding protein [Armatimonadota bacterium]